MKIPDAAGERRPSSNVEKRRITASVPIKAAGTGSLATGALAVLLSACVTNTEITVFDYANHDVPRVSVVHAPLYPDVGETVTLTAVAELAPDAEIDEIGVQRLLENGTVAGEFDCSDAGVEAVCQYTSEQSSEVIYRAYVTDKQNRRRYSPGSYRFSYGRSENSDLTRIPVRVPLIPNDKLDQDYRIDVLLVRDPSEPAEYDHDAFFADLTTLVNEGLLADPVYRWRDDQLGIFVTNRPGRTASFYDGLDTACGQDPWLGNGVIPEAGGIEVIGVLHRRPAQDQGSVLDPAVGFRDCAGFYAANGDVGTFSVRTGTASAAVIGKHEFGHAAFGLGDEYYETDASRRVFPDSSLIDASACCCQCDGPGFVTSDGGGELGSDDLGLQVACNAFSGTACFGNVINPNPVGLQACADFSLIAPLDCLSGSQGRCPPLASTCVLETAWLGDPPPPSYVDEQSGETKTIDPRRHNVFPTEEACIAARQAAEQHPGVENEANTLSACRELCGPESGLPCPCGTSAAWITDAISGAESASHDDAMADVSSPLPIHGGTGAWCVETSLCIRWQSAHSDNFEPVEVWKTCASPPKWTRHFDNLVEYILTETTIRFPLDARPRSVKPVK